MGYTEESSEKEESSVKKADFTPVEQAFNNTYRRYKINGEDVNLTVNEDPVQIYFNNIRKNLIDLIIKNLEELKSAKIQTSLYIKFRKEEEDGTIILVDKVFNSKMTEFFQGSDLNELLDGMFNHMKKQVENPAFEKSGFVIDEILHFDISFRKLNLTRGSSYIPLPKWISKKKAVINPKNENDEECFKWAITAST